MMSLSLNNYSYNARAGLLQIGNKHQEKESTPSLQSLEKPQLPSQENAQRQKFNLNFITNIPTSVHSHIAKYLVSKEKQDTYHFLTALPKAQRMALLSSDDSLVSEIVKDALLKIRKRNWEGTLESFILKRMPFACLNDIKESVLSLNLQKMSLAPRELEEILGLFPRVKNLNLTGCELTDSHLRVVC